jgi:hypothetical protein
MNLNSNLKCSLDIDGSFVIMSIMSIYSRESVFVCCIRMHRSNSILDVHSCLSFYVQRVNLIGHA